MASKVFLLLLTLSAGPVELGWQGWQLPPQYFDFWNFPSRTEAGLGKLDLEKITIEITRKCPLRGHIPAPPEGLRGLGLPGVNPGGQLWGSGGDSKVI